MRRSAAADGPGGGRNRQTSLIWSIGAALLIFVNLFLLAFNVAQIQRSASEDTHEAYSLIVIVEASSFSAARTPRSIAGLVRDTEDPTGAEGPVIIPIDKTPLARVFGQGSTQEMAVAEANRRADVAVAELNRLGSVEARVLTTASVANDERSLPRRLQIEVMALLAAGAVTAAFLTARSHWLSRPNRRVVRRLLVAS